MIYTKRSAPKRLALGATLLLLGSLTAGCAVLGVAAHMMPAPKIKPKVVLTGQAVGVMVWCDRGLRIDWPTVQRDVGAGVQQRLLEAQKAKAKELEGATFPFPAESFIRWQKDHPGFEAEPIGVVAAKLPVTRLIYIEINDLSTRSARSIALYRGSAKASIKVIEVVQGQTTGKVIYEEADIGAVYPKKSSEDGRPDGDDLRMYAGTVIDLADQIAMRFVEHEEEQEK